MSKTWHTKDWWEHLFVPLIAIVVNTASEYGADQIERKARSRKEQLQKKRTQDGGA